MKRKRDEDDGFVVDMSKIRRVGEEGERLDDIDDLASLDIDIYNQEDIERGRFWIYIEIKNLKECILRHF